MSVTESGDWRELLKYLMSTYKVYQNKSGPDSDLSPSGPHPLPLLQFPPSPFCLVRQTLGFSLALEFVLENLDPIDVLKHLAQETKTRNRRMVRARKLQVLGQQTYTDRRLP